MFDDQALIPGKPSSHLADFIEGIRRSPGCHSGMEAHLASAPLFVLDHEACYSVHTAEAARAVQAMVRAGNVQLPHNPMLLEFQPPGGLTIIVRLEAVGEVVRAFPVIRLDERKTLLGLPFDRWIPIQPDPSSNDIFIIGRESMPGFFARDKAGKRIPFDAAQVMNKASRVAICAAMLLKGEVLRPEAVAAPYRLNKRRLRKGRPAIQAYTIVRVERSHAEAGSRWRVRAHWRSAHVRWQRYGHGNALRRPIRLKATLVAHRKGDPIPTREARI